MYAPIAIVYIGGYMDNTTDIEMKRIVTQAGGEILYGYRFARIVLF